MHSNHSTLTEKFAEQWVQAMFLLSLVITATIFIFGYHPAGLIWLTPFLFAALPWAVVARNLKIRRGAMSGKTRLDLFIPFLSSAVLAPFIVLTGVYQ